MSESEEIQKQIAGAVAENPVLLFMKGNPTFPQCGFSQRVVHILESYGVKYKSVDVLEHPEVRQGIKEFSSWPTVPQLYVNGEFVGGCDILVEMHESGELGAVLGAGASAEAPADR